MNSLTSFNQPQEQSISDKLNETFTKTIQIHGITLLHTCFAPYPPQQGEGSSIAKSSSISRSKVDLCDYILTLEQLHYPDEIGMQIEETMLAQQIPAQKINEKVIHEDLKELVIKQTQHSRNDQIRPVTNEVVEDLLTRNPDTNRRDELIFESPFRDVNDCSHNIIETQEIPKISPSKPETRVKNNDIQVEHFESFGSIDEHYIINNKKESSFVQKVPATDSENLIDNQKLFCQSFHQEETNSIGNQNLLFLNLQKAEQNTVQENSLSLSMTGTKIKYQFCYKLLDIQDMVSKVMPCKSSYQCQQKNQHLIKKLTKSQTNQKFYIDDSHAERSFEQNQAILEKENKALTSLEAHEQFKSHFTLALWRMNQGDLPHSIASLDVISETRAFTLLHD